MHIVLCLNDQQIRMLIALCLNDRQSRANLIVFRQKLEVSLGVVANRTLVGSRLADNDMSAVGTLPDTVAFTRENNLILNVLQEFAIALLVVLLDSTDLLELFGNLVKALSTCLGSHAGVHIGPLGIFAGSSIGKVGGGVADLATVEIFVPEFGVLFFVGSRLFEDLANLYITVFLCLGSEESVLVASHRLASKRLKEVLLSLCSF